MNSLTRPPVYKTLVAEAGAVLGVALLMAVVNTVTGWSVFLGGLTYLLPQAWFGWRVFRYRGASVAQHVVNGFYKGEAGKLILSCLGFAAVFSLVKPLNVVAFFATYSVLVVANLVLVARSPSI